MQFNVFVPVCSRYLLVTDSTMLINVTSTSLVGCLGDCWLWCCCYRRCYIRVFIHLLLDSLLWLSKFTIVNLWFTTNVTTALFFFEMFRVQLYCFVELDCSHVTALEFQVCKRWWYLLKPLLGKEVMRFEDLRLADKKKRVLIIFAIVVKFFLNVFFGVLDESGSQSLSFGFLCSPDDL